MSYRRSIEGSSMQDDGPSRVKIHDNDEIWESIGRLRAHASIATLPLSQEAWDHSKGPIKHDNDILQYDEQFPNIPKPLATSGTTAPVRSLFEGWDDPELQEAIERDIEETGWEPLQEGVIQRIIRVEADIKATVDVLTETALNLKTHLQARNVFEGGHAWEDRRKTLASQERKLRFQRESLDEELLQLRNKLFHVSRSIFRRDFKRPFGRRGDDLAAALDGNQQGRHGSRRTGWPDMDDKSLAAYLKKALGFKPTGVKLDAAMTPAFSGHRRTGWPMPGQTMAEHFEKTHGVAGTNIQLTNRRINDDHGRFGLRHTGWPRSAQPFVQHEQKMHVIIARRVDKASQTSSDDAHDARSIPCSIHSSAQHYSTAHGSELARSSLSVANIISHY